MVGGLARPVGIAHAGDGGLFVVEAAGQILLYTVNPDGSLTFEDTFLDINELVGCCGERGLLGLAFHPNYATNRYLFIYAAARPATATPSSPATGSRPPRTPPTRPQRRSC